MMRRLCSSFVRGVLGVVGAGLVLWPGPPELAQASDESPATVSGELRQWHAVTLDLKGPAAREGDPTWRDGRGKGLIGALNYLASKGLNSFSGGPLMPGAAVEGGAPAALVAPVTGDWLALVRFRQPGASSTRSHPLPVGPKPEGEAHGFGGESDRRSAAAASGVGSGEEPLRIVGTTRGDASRPDGGIPPAVGVQNYQVMRASRRHPELSEGFGWTYHHSPDLLYWNDRFHVAWKSNPKDEDVPPGHILLTTSRNGVDWEFPRLLFPTVEVGEGRATEWGARSYFRVADDGRLLAMAGFRDEEVVAFGAREIRRDGTLGPTYWIFRDPERKTLEHDALFPTFTESEDPGFVEACEKTLQDRLFLEQAYDYGRFQELDVRMPWHERLNPERKFGFGKAFSFLRRADGALLAVGKLAWATLSFDGGETWTKPVQPPTLNVSRSKIWAQRTSDSRYAFVYDPIKPGDSPRWPLAIVTGDDGVEFRQMRTVHDEVPRRRYIGLHKNMGPQYVRGMWPPNGKPPGDDLWLVYSVNKEDIWISRVPVPVQTDAAGGVDDDFEASGAPSLIPGWNVYSPLWAPVRVVEVPGSRNRALRLQDRDPHDFARATRLFGAAPEARVNFRAMAEPAEGGRLEVELVGPRDTPAVRLVLESDGRLGVQDGSGHTDAGRYAPGRWIAFGLHADTRTGRYSLTVDGRPGVSGGTLVEGIDGLERITLRTGPREIWIPPVGEDSKYKDVSVDADTDRPLDASVYYVDDVSVR